MVMRGLRWGRLISILLVLAVIAVLALNEVAIAQYVLYTGVVIGVIWAVRYLFGVKRGDYSG